MNTSDLQAVVDTLPLGDATVVVDQVVEFGVPQFRFTVVGAGLEIETELNPTAAAFETVVNNLPLAEEDRPAALAKFVALL